MLVGVLTKSTTLLKMRLQMSESYATWQNLFELICDCVLKESIWSEQNSDYVSDLNE